MYVHCIRQNQKIGYTNKENNLPFSKILMCIISPKGCYVYMNRIFLFYFYLTHTSTQIYNQNCSWFYHKNNSRSFTPNQKFGFKKYRQFTQLYHTIHYSQMLLLPSSGFSPSIKWFLRLEMILEQFSSEIKQIKNKNTKINQNQEIECVNEKANNNGVQFFTFGYVTFVTVKNRKNKHTKMGEWVRYIILKATEW